MNVGVPIEAITDGPRVQWNHIDGPLLSWAGHIHWLTWRERLAIWLRFRTVYEIAEKRWPHFHNARPDAAYLIDQNGNKGWIIP